MAKTKEKDRVTPYQMEFQPLTLKEVALACDISQGELAEAAGVSRPTINLCFNKGYIPLTMADFKEKVERHLATNQDVQQWLLERNLRIADIWAPCGQALRNAAPSGQAQRTIKGQQAKKPALMTGLPEQLIMKWEVEMISHETMKHFKLFRNPFVGDVTKGTDIYRSEEHRYIEAAMLDAAMHGGFLAVAGEVGSGKTTMRREVMEQLKREEHVTVIYPQIIDKTRITASSICDAIIMDLSEERPKVKLEQKTRQVQKLLADRSKAGYQACLIIEEAHDLSTQTFKYLKRFYELEDGYKKLLGIILVGQTELKNMFNESQHVEMREVIRRVQFAEIGGLGDNVKEYLRLKFKRVGGDIDKIMTDGAIAALNKRLTMLDARNKPVSHAYPLLVNNYVARAMNLASDLGEPIITEEVVNGI